MICVPIISREVLDLLRNRAENEQTRTDLAFLQPLPGQATEADIAAAEAFLGFRVPLPVSDVYMSVANGGFGPGYGLVGIGGGSRGFARGTFRGRCEETYRVLRSWTDFDWPERLLPLCDWGCGIYSCVDCSSTVGQILRFYSDAIGDGLPTPFTTEAPDFRSWLVDWLDGVNLWEKPFRHTTLWYPPHDSPGELDQ
jgi:hypothetical protein